VRRVASEKGGVRSQILAQNFRNVENLKDDKDEE